MKLKNVFIISFILFFTGTLFASPEIKISAITDKKEYNPGDTVILALQFKIPDKFHLYGNPLGPGIGKPLALNISNTNGVTWFKAKKMPASKYYPDLGDWVWAYKKNAVFFLVGEISEKIPGRVMDTVTLDGLICENACIPVIKEIPFSISISESKTDTPSFSQNKKLLKLFTTAEEMGLSAKQVLNEAPINLNVDLVNLGNIIIPAGEEEIPQWEYTPQEKRIQLNILLAVFFAFLAGIILNIMPCVLPVLGIKILSFSQAAGSSKRTAIIRSLVFSAGMISVFLVLASFAVFAGLSWGEQFQKPGMLVAIISIIFIFGLGMFDVFMILVPGKVSELEQKRAKGKGLVDDFVKGMFTTILATPCSGPFLGATLAWTLLQPPVTVYVVFASIGAGMAFPYVVFSSSSRLLKLVPKPGAWMEIFKHFMGFLLFGFALYLMIGLPRDMVLPTVGLCLVMAFSIIFYNRFSPFGSPIGKKILIGFTGVLIVVGGWFVNFRVLYNFISEEAAVKAEKGSKSWEEFTPAKLLDAHAGKRHVIVDFTANWCMNCQFNKITVYHTKEINDLIEKKNIVALKADITQKNPAAESLLHHLGSQSVPFLAVFPADDPYNPIIMRDIINKKSLVKVLEGLSFNF